MSCSRRCPALRVTTGGKALCSGSGKEWGNPEQSGVSFWSHSNGPNVGGVPRGNLVLGLSGLRDFQGRGQGLVVGRWYRSERRNPVLAY